jgi:hypothetical protein
VSNTLSTAILTTGAAEEVLHGTHTTSLEERDISSGKITALTILAFKDNAKPLSTMLKNYPI